MVAEVLHRSVLIVGAGTPWVDALAVALAERCLYVQTIALYDFRAFLRSRGLLRSPSHPRLVRCEWVFPPGYAGLLSKTFAPLLRIRLSKSLRRLREGGREASVSRTWVISTYPWFNAVVRDVPDANLIYYCLDDYALYRRGRAALIRRQEAQMIKRAALTLCLSSSRTRDLGDRFTSCAPTIRHFPLGVADDYIVETPRAGDVRCTVGYIGNLSDRVDWQFVADVARALPEFKFVFLGTLDDASSGDEGYDWQADRRCALAVPNVAHCGNVRQCDVASYYTSFTINWIPYAQDHPFNLASCPTKIMDGLASGRPLVSTEIPECRLYPEYIRLVRTVADAVQAITAAYDEQLTPEFATHARRQIDFARSNTWATRVATLLQWLT